MQPEESLYPAHWLRIAEKDWKRVAWLLDAGDAELAGLCLQQALEKFLKAFLLSKGGISDGLTTWMPFWMTPLGTILPWKSSGVPVSGSPLSTSLNGIPWLSREA